uniref:ELKS/RAB6-interacting/CAST family member 2 n=1 Tax=Eptatretus burgeri TaxID=7764 RepID=A0A8C4X0A9_EPTBU
MFGGTRPAAVPERLVQSPARSPRLPRSPRLGHRRSNSGGDSSGAGHTLSMENIQSLNAAYATSGPTYFSDFDTGLQATPLPGKGVLTLGRAPGGGSRLVYPVGGGSRLTTMGSSPNIPAASSGMDASLYQIPELGRRDNQLEFQTQMKEMVRENELLRKELEVKDSKLGSSMNSIRTFWSPELKKERAHRKDEVARIAVLREQLRVTHDDSQSLQLTVHALQEELRVQRDLAQLLQGEVAGRGTSMVVMGGGIGDKLPSEESVQRLRAEHERQAKELYLLRQTLEEMELRIETQKQTLNSRDESIRKLLEMLQQGAGGRIRGHGGDELDGDYGGGDGDGVRQLAEAESQIARLESLLEHRERENQQFREEIQRRSEAVLDGGKTKALHTVIEMKDTKIASLEQGMRDLEDEIQTLRSSGALSMEEREEEIKQIEVYKSHSKFMKNKMDQLKQELSRKDSELLALQTRLETLTNQNSDSQQHIEVLKESLTAKEQRAAILQAEVEALRLRLEEKEALLARKSQQVQELSDEKCSMTGEIRDLKDMMEVKERKINVLQKKIENLQEQIRDKEKQLGSLKERLKSLQADSSNTDTALATLEEALSEKEQMIEQMKEQCEREEREKQDETDAHKRESKELKERINTLLSELSEKEATVLDLKEHASSLASSRLKKDSRLKALEIALEQKKEECNKLDTQLRKEGHAEAGRINEQSELVRQLEGELGRRKDEAGRAQTEVDRLLDILRQTETEKHDKDMKIAELERHFKEKGKKVSGLKQKEAAERRHALPDEAQGREAGSMDNGLHLQESLRQRDERIKELEEALRESIHISTEREMLLSQEQSQCNSALKQVEELEALLERSRQEVESTRARLSSTQRSLAEREARLTSLRAERRRQLEEVLEMKQEALLAAISEKDANIALLELSASKRKKTQEEVAALKREKDRLVQQLKQQTQNRMKLMADCYEDDERLAVRTQPVSQGSSADQMIQSLRRVHNEQEKLQLYIEHLVLLCEQRDPQTLMGLPGLPLEPGDYVGAADNAVNLAVGEALEGAVGTDGDKNQPARNLEQVAEELERGQQRAASLQELANSLLQRISERCPDLLEQVVRALEEVE